MWSIDFKYAYIDIDTKKRFPAFSKYCTYQVIATYKGKLSYIN